jgi:hypothetical protein
MISRSQVITGPQNYPRKAQACRSVLERGAEVAEHAELGEDDRAFGVAVEPHDPAVDQLEDVAARCVRPLAGRRQRPGGQVQRAEVRSLQSQLAAA